MAKRGPVSGLKKVAAERPQLSGKKTDSLLSDSIRMALLRDPARLAQIGEKFAAMAAQGNAQALALIMDRLEGKAVAKVEQDIKTTGFVVRAPEVNRNREEWQAMHAPPKVVEDDSPSVN